MAVTKQDMDLTSSLSVIRDTDSDSTSESDVNGGAATLYLIEVDNTNNAAATSYLKLYDHASPTIGTTGPHMIIPAAGGAITRVAISEGIAFGTGVSFATVTTAGTAGTTNPTSDVEVALVVA